MVVNEKVDMLAQEGSQASFNGPVVGYPSHAIMRDEMRDVDQMFWIILLDRRKRGILSGLAGKQNNLLKV